MSIWRVRRRYARLDPQGRHLRKWTVRPTAHRAPLRGRRPSAARLADQADEQRCVCARQMKVGSYVVVFISVRIWSIVNRGALLYHWRGRDGGNELTRPGRHDQSQLRATATKRQSVLSPLSAWGGVSAHEMCCFVCCGAGCDSTPSGRASGRGVVHRVSAERPVRELCGTGTQPRLCLCPCRCRGPRVPCPRYFMHAAGSASQGLAIALVFLWNESCGCLYREAWAQRWRARRNRRIGGAADRPEAAATLGKEAPGPGQGGDGAGGGGGGGGAGRGGGGACACRLL
eukprot:COSAG01_NODE_10138_length_2240_cov_1.299393_1_plen_287_part_00